MVVAQQKEIETERNSNQSYLGHVVRERESTQKLLRMRNENELHLQNDILEKNKLIKDLTKKLKDSTQIIIGQILLIQIRLDTCDKLKSIMNTAIRQ